MIQNSKMNNKRGRKKRLMKRDISLSVSNRLLMIGPLNEPFDIRDNKTLGTSPNPQIKQLSQLVKKCHDELRHASLPPTKPRYLNF